MTSSLTSLEPTALRAVLPTIAGRTLHCVKFLPSFSGCARRASNRVNSQLGLIYAEGFAPFTSADRLPPRLPSVRGKKDLASIPPSLPSGSAGRLSHDERPVVIGSPAQLLPLRSPSVTTSQNRNLDGASAPSLFPIHSVSPSMVTLPRFFSHGREK